MKHSYLISWQKWYDPFGSDEDQTDSSLIKNNFEEDYHEDDEENTNTASEQSHPRQPMKAIATPFGIIPYTENTASSKIFNFWVGHCNFDITKYISDLIEQSPGVEALDVFTRYRFRIAIGKVFDGAEVMKTINDTVYRHLDTYGNTE